MARRRTLRFPQPIGVQVRQFRAATLAAITDSEQRARYEKDFPEDSLPKLPRKRNAAAQASSLQIPSQDRTVMPAAAAPLEAAVITAVSQLLAVHPRVMFALRQNSGGSYYQNAAGKQTPLWFYRWVRRPELMRVVDFWGATTDGKLLALEAKRAGWKQPCDERERQQAAFLSMVRKCGGIGEFVTCLEDAQEALK